jgi:hypothetical protein
VLSRRPRWDACLTAPRSARYLHLGSPMKTARRWVRRLVMTGTVILLAASLVACGGDTTGLDPLTELVGVYELESMDGEPPPWLVELGVGTRSSTVGVTLSLEPDRTFSEEHLRRMELWSFSGALVLDETLPLPGGGGTWSYSQPGNCPQGCLTTVTLLHSTGSSETCTAGAGRLTVVRNGSAWVFRRRI